MIPESVFSRPAFNKSASKATVHSNLENKSLRVIFRIVLVVGIKLKLVLDFSSRLFYPKGNSDFKPIYHALENTDLCFSSDYYDVKQFNELFISHRVLFYTDENFFYYYYRGLSKEGKTHCGPTRLLWIKQIILTF